MGHRADELPHLQDQELLSRWSRTARLLIDAGGLDEEEVVDGDVVLEDVSSRNRNAIVSRTAGSRLFVKTAVGAGREADRYARLLAVPGLAPFLPVVDRTSSSEDLLVLRVEDGAADLWNHHLAREAFPAHLGAAVGRALALLHSGTRTPGAPRPAEHLPVALDIHRPHVAMWRELSPAAAELVGMLQEDDRMVSRFEDLRRSWGARSTIHGDVKWPNIVVVPGSRPFVRLVDWEHSDEGDPAWDVGSALAAYLGFWLYSISPKDDEGDPAGLAAAARFPLGRMRRAITALWETYVTAGGPGDVGVLRWRSTAFCGVRLVQSAFEESDGRTRLSGRGALHLQVAANILRDPDAAAERLLGLEMVA